MNYWLLVERYENWLIDSAEGFVRFGIPAGKASLASQVKADDTLIFYISSKISAFSHIRRATADGLQKLGLRGEYDIGYAFAISTIPELVLPRAAWVPIKSLENRLEFAAGKDLRVALRTTIKRLTPNDARVITDAMKKRVSPTATIAG